MEINTNALTLYNIFLKINQLCRELEIYVRLEDYSKDHLKKSDEIYNQIMQEYDNYCNQKEKYYNYLLAISSPIIKQQTTEAHTVYYKMLDYINGELQLLKDFKVNFCVKIFTSNLPVEKLLDQIKASDNLLESVQVPQIQEMNYAQNVINIAKSHVQKTKREAIDNYSVEARNSDDYTNRFIDNYLLYLNEYLIFDFNNFVKYSPENMLLYPKNLVGFKIDSIKKDFVQIKTVYKASEIPALQVKKQTIVIPGKTLDALNNYIEFINEELRINYDYAIGLYNINKSANKQLETNANSLYLSSNYYDGYALPTAAYEKTMNESQYIDKEYRDILNLILKELYDIITEKYMLELELDKYVQSKKYIQDRYTHLYEILKRFEYLINMFDKQKQLLYEYTRQIAESYLPVTKSPWTIGGQQMLKQLDVNLQTLNQLKEESISKKFRSVSSSSIAEISREMLLKEYENLNGLKKIGEYHGQCPYNPYEDIATNSSLFAESIAKFPNIERIKNDLPNYYRDYIYQFNLQVDNYNKFVNLAAGGYEAFDTHKTKEVYLLKNVRQQVFFKMEKPQSKSIIPIDEPVKDVPKIIMDGFAANNLVLLLDISGSMKTEDKLPLLRSSFLEILPYLRAEDEIAIVAFSNNGAVLLKSVSCSEKEKITEVFKSLESEGLSNFDKGLKLAYKVARSNFKTDANNRIIIATDGAFAIGNELYKIAEEESDKKTYLSVFSFGNKDNKVRSLDKLASKGKGNYEYIEVSNAVDKLLKELQALKVK